MLSGDASHRTFQRRGDLNLLRHLGIVLLRQSGHGNGVLHEGGLTRQDRAVVRGRIPGEDFRRLALTIQLANVLDGVDRLLGVQRDLTRFVLLGAAEGPEDGPRGHVGIQLLREPDSDRIAEFLLDPLPADQEVVVRVGSVRESDLRPEVLAVVARIGHEGV